MILRKRTNPDVPGIYIESTPAELSLSLTAMFADGWMREKPAIYNPATHKPSITELTDDMINVFPVIIEKTVEEKAEYITKVTNEIITKYEQAIQSHLDLTAKLKGYGDNKTAPSVSARSYTGFENPFQAECILYAKWCAACWIYAYTQLELVKSGTRAIPDSTESFISELPAFSWE